MWASAARSSPRHPGTRQSTESAQSPGLRGAGGVEEAETVRLGGRLAAAGHAQLAQDVGHVDAGRLGRDEQRAGDLPVAAPGRDQAEHLEFALGQPEPEPKPELARASAVGTSNNGSRL